jgi:tmRNA-binding protein
MIRAAVPLGMEVFLGMRRKAPTVSKIDPSLRRYADRMTKLISEFTYQFKVISKKKDAAIVTAQATQARLADAALYLHAWACTLSRLDADMRNGESGTEFERNKAAAIHFFDIAELEIHNRFRALHENADDTMLKAADLALAHSDTLPNSNFSIPESSPIAKGTGRKLKQDHIKQFPGTGREHSGALGEAVAIEEERECRFAEDLDGDAITWVSRTGNLGGDARAVDRLLDESNAEEAAVHLCLCRALAGGRAKLRCNLAEECRLAAYGERGEACSRRHCGHPRRHQQSLLVRKRAAIASRRLRKERRAPPNNAGVDGAHEERRRRKLLVSRRDLADLWNATQRKGMTLVPLVMYFNHRGIAKIKLGIAKGKKNVDKRETEAKRDWNRQKQRLLKDTR